MRAFTDEQMNTLLKTTKAYSLVILRAGPERSKEGAAKLVWEHGRRNFALRAQGLLSIVCPVASDAIAGIGIFNVGTEEAARIMEGDPAVREGVLLYEVYPCRSFPGDSLPQ